MRDDRKIPVMAGLEPATQLAARRRGAERLFQRTVLRLLNLLRAQTRARWVAGSRPAMTILRAAFAFTLALASAHAVEPDEVLADPVLEARARAVTQELRCVVCQNQSVDDSDAPLARDIRVLVRERIAGGDSDAQARDFVVARYGDFVLLRPPLKPETLLLWLGPGLLLVGGLALAWVYVRRVGRTSAAVQPLTASEEDDVRRILDDGPR